MAESKSTEHVAKSDAEWRKLLTEDEFKVLRQKHTEARSALRWSACLIAIVLEDKGYTHCKDEGTYKCKGCGAALFDSTAKFDRYVKPLLNSVNVFCCFLC